MIKPLILLVGQSGSGKTTIANYLETNYGYKQLQSYTTRKPRYEGETGHTFISEEEFNKLDNLVAYTEYNGHQYGVTAEMIDQSDIYVIDVPGVASLFEKYQCEDRQIYVFYLESTVATRIDRMIERGDHDAAIVSRLHNDEQYDWYEELHKYVLPEMIFGHTSLRVIDADKDLDNVINQITLILDNKEF